MKQLNVTVKPPPHTPPPPLIRIYDIYELLGAMQQNQTHLESLSATQLLFPAR